MKRTRYIKPQTVTIAAEAVVMSATSPSWNNKEEDEFESQKQGDVINEFDDSPTNWGKNY